MHSDNHSNTEIDRDAYDDLISQSEPIEPPTPRDGEVSESAPPDSVADFEAAPNSGLATPAPSIPHLRAQLHAFKRDLTGLRDAISELDEKATDIPPASRIALAAIAAGQRIPPVDTDEPVLCRWRDHAPTDKLLSFRTLALEEIDVQMRIIKKSILSLETLDTFNKPALSTWSNLPPAGLAREINAYAHLVFSSAIVR